jgi:hypothetical protein
METVIVWMLIGWALVAVAGGIVFGRIVRNHQESELAIPLDAGEDMDEVGPVYPVYYPVGVTVRALVNQFPDGQLVKIGSQGVVLGVTASREAAEPIYHVRWNNGAVSLLPESVMDVEVAVLHRAAA